MPRPTTTMPAKTFMVRPSKRVSIIQRFRERATLATKTRNHEKDEEPTEANREVRFLEGPARTLETAGAATRPRRPRHTTRTDSRSTESARSASGTVRQARAAYTFRTESFASAVRRVDADSRPCHAYRSFEC